jgi:hypothetical protein
MVISQAKEGKLRIRNIDEFEAKRATIANATPSSVLAGGLPPAIERDLEGYAEDEKRDSSEKQ